MNIKDYISKVKLTYNNKSYVAEVLVRRKVIVFNVDDMNLIKAIQNRQQKVGLTERTAYSIIFERAKKLYNQQNTKL
jgi:hypothetical protein